MRTREEIAKCLNEISNQLIELTLYDLQGDEQDHVNNARSSIDDIYEGIMEELSKNELAELSKQIPETQIPKTEEPKGCFVKGYYYEYQTKEQIKKSAEEAIASGASYPDIYGDFF